MTIQVLQLVNKWERNQYTLNRKLFHVQFKKIPPITLPELIIPTEYLVI